MDMKRKGGFSIYNIPFKITGIKDSFEKEREWLKVTEGDDLIKISICKEFPTPGYSLKVDKIAYEDNIYYIYLSITAPSPNAILLQAITYKKINIEINKKYIKAPPPYIFKIKSMPATIRSRSIKEE